MSDVILDTVFIETTTACTRSCRWCTRYYHDVKPEFMSENLFFKIIRELGAINFSGRLSLFQNGEPLLDDRLSRWLAICKKHCPNSFTLIISNGDLLTSQKAKELFDSGLNALKVSAYDTETLTKATAIADCLENCYKPMILIENLSAKTDWSSRGGTVPYRNQKKRPTSSVCLRPFRQMYIAYNGLVAQCCSDYLLTEIMGDTTKESLMDIWNGKRFAEVRAGLLGKALLAKLCQICDIEPDYLTTDDIKKIFQNH